MVTQTADFILPSGVCCRAWVLPCCTLQNFKKCLAVIELSWDQVAKELIAESLVLVLVGR
jgi:hypothetical protein